jgi:hypothetical protein
MANLSTQTITRAGIGPTYAAAAGGGDTFTPDVDTFSHVKNGSGSPITVTVVTPRTDQESGQAIADVTVSVPATTGERMIGPFPHNSFADPTDGLADITYSGVTSLTVAVLKVQE